MSGIGCVDAFIETGISGWAADPADFDRQVFVEIVINCVPVAAVPGTMFREDLLRAGLGDGRKGFQFDPGPWLRPGCNEIGVRYADSGLTLEKGRGCLIRPYGGAALYPRGSLVAALQAYFEFGPERRIVEIAPGRGEFLKTILEAHLPFRSYTGVESSSERIRNLRASFRDPRVEFRETFSSAGNADLLVCPAAAWDLKKLLEQDTARPRVLVVEPFETQTAEELQGLLRSFGASRVNLESISCDSGGYRLAVIAEFGQAENVRNSRTLPVLAHIHIPKCAGTSFRLLLEKFFGAAHTSLYVEDTYFVYTEESLRGFLLRDAAARACSSHHIRTFPHWLAGREMLYVTFLRHPVEQFVSYMTHIQKHYANTTSRSLLEAVPPDAPRLPLRDFAEWLLSNPNGIPFRENHNVNFFARHSSPAAADRLEAAKAALSGFFFVGVTECMEESVGKLRALMRSEGLEFPPDPIGVENTSRELRRDLSWINPLDKVGAMLLDSITLDLQLYDWAVARLEEDYWAARRSGVFGIRQF